MEGRIRDSGTTTELELLQPRETKCGGSFNLVEITAAQSRDAQRGREAEHGGRQRPPRLAAQVEIELLEAIEGGGAEPAVELSAEAAVEADAVAVTQGEAASGAGVHGEDLGEGDVDVLAHPAVNRFVVDVAEERAGEPD